MIRPIASSMLIIVFQLLSTFIILLGIYMIYAAFDNDFGFDGLVGLIIFQPLLGSIISIFSIIVGIILGLPIRLNKRINIWWRKNFYLAIVTLILGIACLILSFTTSNAMNKQPFNSTLVYAGWFLCTMGLLHMYPPNFIIDPLKNLFNRKD